MVGCKAATQPTRICHHDVNLTSFRRHFDVDGRILGQGRRAAPIRLCPPGSPGVPGWRGRGRKITLSNAILTRIEPFHFVEVEAGLLWGGCWVLGSELDCRAPPASTWLHTHRLSLIRLTTNWGANNKTDGRRDCVVSEHNH